MAEEDNIETESKRNWSELRLELLELILKRLALVDMARFKLVSKSWFAAAKSYVSSPVTYKPLVAQAPWLVLPRRSNRYDCRFYSLSEKEVYTFRSLFEGYGDHDELLGSSHGWLVILAFSDLHRYNTIHLLNPISRARILLPPLGSHNYMILRAFLSSDPSCNNTFYVAVIYSAKRDVKLAFHKHGNDESNTPTWTDLDCVDGRFGRIFFHNSLLYGMSLDSNTIRVWDLGATTSPIKTIDFQPPERDTPQRNHGLYLVESQGEILFVEKLRNPISGQFYYDVRKLDFCACNKVECLKVKRLQERCLVLNSYGSASISLSTLDFPQMEANSIYEAKDVWVWPIGGHGQLYLEVEAYDLEKEVFKSIFKSQVRRVRPLLWIVPNPCEV